MVIRKPTPSMLAIVTAIVTTKSKILIFVNDLEVVASGNKTNFQ